MALFLTLFLGMFFVVGAFILHEVKHEEIYEHLSIAIAFGALISIVFVDLGPEVMEAYPGADLVKGIVLVIVGIGLLKLLDIFVPDHDAAEGNEMQNMIHIGLMSLIAISIHNIVEGMTVYSIAVQDLSSGLSLAVGVGLHNIPMGMLVYSTLKKDRMRKRIIVLSVATFSTFIGGLIMFMVNSMLPQFIINALLCIALGMVLFITIFELLPDMIHGKMWKRSAIGIIIGVVFVAASLLFE